MSGRAAHGANDQAAATAIPALQGFNRWLEDHLGEKVSDWRLGKDLYAKKFRLVLATGKTPEALLAEAEADLTQVRAEIARLSTPNTVEQALANAGAPARHGGELHVLSEAGAGVGDGLRQRSKDLLTLPPNANLEVIDTPGVHARHLWRRWIQLPPRRARAEAGSVLLGDTDPDHLASGAHRFEAA